MQNAIKRGSVILVCLFMHVWGYAQLGDDTLQARIILIGDAGQFNAQGNHPVVAAVKNNMHLNKKTTIIYLGDNIYKAGLPDDQYMTYNAARAILDTQVNVARGTGAKVYVIPGNHDWDEYGKGGWNAVMRQQRYVDALGDENVQFYPQDGCPGPVAVNITKEVVLIMMDSQWWLHQYDKPGIESDCDYKTKQQVLNELDDILDKNSKKLVIIAMHHPLKSYGIHGGNFSWKQYLFPLTDIRKNLYIPFPGIGLIYPIVRGVFGTPQDMKHPAYANMINEIQDVVNTHQNVIFVAGHEHTQQLIKDSGYYYIVSGSAAKESRVDKGPNSLFASSKTGFATLEVSNNKNVRATFYNVDEKKMDTAYSANLFNFRYLNDSTLQDTLRKVDLSYTADSITIAANPRYAIASGIKKFFNGTNYRKEWATPVKMKVFYLNKLGFTIENLGGGKQTKTLTLRDKEGKRWVLRTIDKDLDKFLPAGFKGTVAENYIRDFISTAHPYAPLIVPPIANAAGIVVARPSLYFIPNDPALGLYRTIFANKVAMLERKEPTPDGADTKSTYKLLIKTVEDNDNHVDQKKVLQSRLLDVLIGDWDRHFDQWRFGESDTGKGKLYYPIPRDRDEALSYSDGLIIKLISKTQMPFLRGFQKDINNFKWQSYWARDFDRLFLNNLSRQNWIDGVKAFQRNVTDAVIHQAVKQMPPEVYAIRGKEIENTLISRREKLMEQAIKYYRFLSEEVTVAGSNQKEYFKISRDGDDLHVKVYKRKRNLDSVSVMYDRVFTKNETKEIRLFGLGRDDIFEVDSNVNSSIQLRLIGGKGEDTFNVKGNIENLIYDVADSNNYVQNANRSKLRLSNDIEVNDYSPTGFQYNRFNFPIVNLGYNVEDGLMAGLGISRRTYGFRKEPYASDHRFSSLYALGSSSYQINYRGDFTQVFGKTGVLIKVALVKPILNNFFGLGNITQYNKALKNPFYRVRYNYSEFELFFTKHYLRNVFTVGAGPKFFHYWNRPGDNVGKILNNPSSIGLDSISVYQTKSYAGFKAFAIANTINNELFPTRGVIWNTELSALAALRNTKPLTSLTSDITLYTSITDPAKFVIVSRIGGGHIFSKNFEYFQALNLGQNNYLRGFRKNRFSGRSLAYGSLEARIKLFDTKSYFLPGAFGLLAFNDVGRVWVQDEDSKRWHYSVGGGFYYAAFNTVLISAAVAFSKEEALLNVTIGTKFNLNF